MTVMNFIAQSSFNRAMSAVAELRKLMGEAGEAPALPLLAYAKRKSRWWIDGNDEGPVGFAMNQLLKIPTQK